MSDYIVNPIKKVSELTYRKKLVILRGHQLKKHPVCKNDIPMTPQPQLSAAPKSPETGLSWVRASFLANINNTDSVWFGNFTLPDLVLYIKL